MSLGAELPRRASSAQGAAETTRAYPRLKSGYDRARSGEDRSHAAKTREAALVKRALLGHGAGKDPLLVS